MKKIIELARPGTFGQAGTKVTLQDLKEITETFSGSSPITLGHQLADWMPAFGKVLSVSLDTKDSSPALTGEIEMHDLLADAWDEGFFQGWSIGAPKGPDGKRYLHHLAVLGAIPPKIQGLRELGILMSDCPSQDIWTFGDIEDKAAFMARVNQEKEHLKWRIDDVKAILDRVTAWSLEMALTGVVPAEFKDQVQLLSDRLTPSLPDPEKTALQAKLSAANTRILDGAKADLQKSAEGRIPAGMIPTVMALADLYGLEETLELSDDQGKTHKLTGFELLKSLFESIPKPVIAGAHQLADTSETIIDLKGIMSRI